MRLSACSIAAQSVTAVTYKVQTGACNKRRKTTYIVVVVNKDSRNTSCCKTECSLSNSLLYLHILWSQYRPT